MPTTTRSSESQAQSLSRSSRPRPAATLLLTLAFGWGMPVSGETFTVGAGGTCTHGTLTSALQAAADNGSAQDEIHLAELNLASHGLVVATPVRIVGGYASCDDPTPTNDFTGLDGSGAGQHSVMEILGPIEVHLERLKILGGDPDPGNPLRGGGVTIEGSTVAIVDSLIRFNAAQNGGGILVEDATLTLDGTVVEENQADDGGALHCYGSTVILRETVLDFNEVGALGGGVFAGDCEITGEDLEVTGNLADASGGGLYLTEGSSLMVTGDSRIGGNHSMNSEVLAPGGLPTTADCLLAFELATLPNAAESLVADPLFAETETFALQAQSPAVDYCDDLVYSATVPDLHGPRGPGTLRNRTTWAPSTWGPPSTDRFLETVSSPGTRPLGA